MSTQVREAAVAILTSDGHETTVKIRLSEPMDPYQLRQVLKSGLDMAASLLGAVAVVEESPFNAMDTEDSG